MCEGVAQSWHSAIDQRPDLGGQRTAGGIGPQHFTIRDKNHAAKRLQKRLEDLGFAVEIRPTTAEVSI
jgi:hypothetical protein